ncbi:MAG: hypothetical protein ACOY5Y_19715 [Pseudomonadota bacterium]
MKKLAALVGVIGLSAGSAAYAQAPQAPQVVRGVATDVQPDRVTVRPSSGKPVVIGLTKDWRVAVTKPIKVSEIKPGSFIGTSEMPQADGRGRSLEVHVFPPGVKIGEGHYAWDKKKGSMMTNGTVGKVTVSKNGRELEVNYGTGQRSVTVPPRIPIVQIADGERAQLRKGMPVFIIAAPAPGGGLVTNAVSIGEGGAKPPM